MSSPMSNWLLILMMLCVPLLAQAAPTQTCASTAPPPSRYQHVVVFSFENRTWSGTGGIGFGATAMPYMHSLAASCSYFSDWAETNTSQNSLTQYIGETSGVNNLATVNDCNPSATCRSTDNNIFRQVRLAGGTARSYVEGATTGCSAAGNAAKHIPGLYYYGSYTDSSGVTHNDHDFCSTEVRPYSEFNANNLPTYAFITPTLCNDGHDCNNSTVDAWASAHVQAVLNSSDYLAGNTAVLVWYDEDHPVPNAIIAPTAHAGNITQTGIGSHAALLKTIELMLGLPVMQQGQLITAADLRAITGLASTGGSTVSVFVSPTSSTILSGNTLQFTGSVTGTTNTGVTWTATKGTVSSTGLFTAPTVTAKTIGTVKATSVADTAKSASATVTVTPVLVPPTAVLTVSPQKGAVPLTVIADSSGSSDTDGSIVSRVIDFGDGTKAKTVTASHTYTTAASYTVKLSVTDNLGLTSATTQNVSVRQHGGHGNGHNSGFELGPIGWVINQRGRTTVAVVHDAARAHGGTNYAEARAGPAQYVAYFVADAKGRPLYIPVNPGQVITFGGWVYRVSGDGYARWKIQLSDAHHKNILHVGPVPDTVKTVGTWTFLHGTYTVPKGKAYVRFLFDVYRSTVPTLVRFDDGMLQIK